MPILWRKGLRKWHFLVVFTFFLAVERKLDWLLGNPESDEISSYIRNVIRSLKIHQDAKCTINLILSHFISWNTFIRWLVSHKAYNTNTNLKQNHKIRNTNTKLYNTNTNLKQNHKIRNTNTKLYHTNTNLKQNHKIRKTNTKFYHTNTNLKQNHKIHNTNTKLYTNTDLSLCLCRVLC